MAFSIKVPAENISYIFKMYFVAFFFLQLG